MFAKRPLSVATVWLVTLLAAPALFAIDTLPAEQLETFVSSNDAVVIDVRTAEEYAAGHVAGALNVPHERIVAEPALLDAYRDRNVVLYCRSGRRVGLAAEALEQAGFDRLYHLEGDMIGWQQRQQPLVQGPQPDCDNC